MLITHIFFIELVFRFVHCCNLLLREEFLCAIKMIKVTQSDFQLNLTNICFTKKMYAYATTHALELGIDELKLSDFGGLLFTFH